MKQMINNIKMIHDSWHLPATDVMKNNINIMIMFKKYAFISYQYKILSKLKKIVSMGTSHMDWFYKEK